MHRYSRQLNKCRHLHLMQNTSEMYNTGFVHSSDTGFNSIEKCEEFILKYHKYHNKIGKYTVETVKKIDLE